MRVQVALLRDHPRQQRRLEHVEGKAEAKVARPLKKQARQPAVAAHMELIGHVARRQRHAVQVGDVPAGEDMPPRPRIVPQRVDQGSDLVMPLRGAAEQPLPRSEEHTSELQSLMRISYAVFCLKKKKKPYK